MSKVQPGDPNCKRCAEVLRARGQKYRLGSCRHHGGIRAIRRALRERDKLAARDVSVINREFAAASRELYAKGVAEKRGGSVRWTLSQAQRIVFGHQPQLFQMWV